MKAILAKVILAATVACVGVNKASAALVTESLTIHTNIGDYTTTSLPMGLSDKFYGYISGFTGLQYAYVHVNEVDDLLNFTISAKSRQGDYCDVICGPVYRELFAQFELTPTQTIKEGSSFTTGIDYDASDNINNIGYKGIEGYDTFYRQYFYPTNVTFIITQTPLPASAPMFGSAVLALGLAGYGLRRKTATPAA